MDEKKVEDIFPEKDVDSLIRQMKAAGGFTGKKLGLSVDILEKMITEECTNFLSFPACIISTGLRGIIKELVKEELVDCVITTTGTLDHDLARIWKDYLHGKFNMDDVELHKQGVNRLGNILIPNESYGIVLEEKLQPLFKEIYSNRKEISAHELIWAIGSSLKENKKESITYWAYKNEIPMIIPGFFDGAVGSQLWFYWQNNRDIKLDLFRDEQLLSDYIFDAKKTGALMIGGGISKHHVIWWNQFRDGLDYSVYVTTASEHDGSLSGARLKEAVSWGKLKEDATYTTVKADATIVLPFMISALKQRLK